MKKILFGSLLLGIVAACSKTPVVTARTQYVDIKGLASVTVDTPDPKKDSAYWGEKLKIDWNTGNEKSPVTLVARIRLRNGTEKRIEKKLVGKTGSEDISFDAHEFNLTGGIVSYKIELIANDKVIARSLHRLWIEPIATASQK